MQFQRRTTLADSGTVTAVSYNHDAQRMRIEFVRNHAIWDYLGVPPTEYASLVAAPSPGAVFNERIRGRYDAIQIHVEEVEERTVPASKKRRGQIVMLDSYESLG